MFNQLLLATIFLNICTLQINGMMSVTKVKSGEQVTLLCLSNDDNHRFLFWELDDRGIVGPGNQFNELKYDYEVLTGKLFIWSVTTKEAGFYRCVSRGNENNGTSFHIHTNELIVLKNPAGWESEFEMNLLRGLTAVMVIVVIVALILLIAIKKQRRSKKNLDLPITNNFAQTKYQSHSPASKIEEGIDNPGLDVDFPKVFQNQTIVQQVP